MVLNGGSGPDLGTFRLQTGYVRPPPTTLGFLPLIDAIVSTNTVSVAFHDRSLVIISLDTAATYNINIGILGLSLGLGINFTSVTFYQFEKLFGCWSPGSAQD